MKVLKALKIVGGGLLAFVLVIGAEVLLSIAGSLPPFQNPGHESVKIGSLGPRLVYVVMGDSTSAGRGGNYGTGIAMATARHLALTRQVEMTNLSVSGAKIEDVARDQLQPALKLNPDVVLLSVGANDATHFTSNSKLNEGMTRIINMMLARNCRAKIVLTGAPDLGSSPRFAQPLRWFAGTQTSRVNGVLHPIVHDRKLGWAWIARDTGPLFKRDPSLFASDRFHPNDRGYAAWIPVLNKALDEAIQLQPSHC